MSSFWFNEIKCLYNKINALKRLETQQNCASAGCIIFSKYDIIIKDMTNNVMIYDNEFALMYALT